MGFIHILPDNVKNMIAAGEVVAGPHSVLKELAENSIDAGAKRISVSITEAGMKKIIVTDDGSGIARDDLPLTIAEHATSKITEIDDIFSIYSYGFRGEALSSIASVSQITIQSRRGDETTGGKLTARSGEIAIVDYMGPTGTIISVENLFYNTPARKKFMKSLQGEQKMLKDLFFSIALARPEIAFSCTFDEKDPLAFPAAESDFARIRQIEGSGADALLFGELADIDVTLKGYLSPPDAMKRTRADQYLFVNRRAIDQRHLNFHLMRAYEGFNASGYPAAYIYLEIKPELIDVNIHPAKKEIKFFDQKYIDSLIYSLAKKILGTRSFSFGAVHTKEESVIAPQFAEKPALLRVEPAVETDAPVQNLINESSVSYIRESAPVFNTSPAQPAESASYRIIGSLFNTYILIESENDFLVIDFHAAHERMLFDKIRSKAVEDDIIPLIFPETVELPPRSSSHLLDNLDAFRSAGFDIDQISEHEFAVAAVPALLKGIDINAFLHDYVSSDHSVFSGIRDEIAAKAACHSARRAGDRLSHEEMATLARLILDGDMEKRCPHGRPFLFKVTRDEFEKLFRRGR